MNHLFPGRCHGLLSRCPFRAFPYGVVIARGVKKEEGRLRLEMVFIIDLYLFSRIRELENFLSIELMRIRELLLA